MADKDLRKRLATAAFLALDETTLDTINARLLNIEGGGKIPLTIKYDFTIDDLGVMGVDITAKCNLILHSLNVSLTTDGNQLRLFKEANESVAAKAEPVTPPVPEKKASKAKPAKKKPAKKAKAVKKKAKAVSTTEDLVVESMKASASIPRGDASKASERLATIAANNEQLYIDNVIDRVQAKMAGVDVDRIDGVVSGESSSVGLTEEEMGALKEMVT